MRRGMYSEQVALERSTTAWFVMVCVCSLRTQQCAVLLVPCLFVLFVLVISAASALVGWVLFSVDKAFDGEFDPGSGRTLAACLTHASRAVRPFGVHERRTGE